MGEGAETSAELGDVWYKVKGYKRNALFIYGRREMLERGTFYDCRLYNFREDIEGGTAQSYGK